MPKSHEELHLQDDTLFRRNWNLCFINESTHIKWISHKSKKRRMIFEVGIMANLIYFGLTLMMRIFLLSSQYHMGGIIYTSMMFAFSLGCFTLVCGSRTKAKLRKRIVEAIDQRNKDFFMAMFYPILLLRCCGYLHFVYINCYVEEIEPLYVQWEAVSFWCYMLVWKGFPLIIAGLPFSLVLPSFILSCFCSFFPALLLKTALVFLQSTIQFALSLAFLCLYYLILRREMSEFAWKLQCESSVKREKQISKEITMQEAENTMQQVQQKAMMFGELAHDVGTPLAALSMAIELLHSALGQSKTEESAGASNGNLKHEQVEVFETIRASITMIQGLRESMLDLAKKAHGLELKPSYEEVDIEMIISKKVFPVLKRLLGSKSKSITPSWYVDPNLANTLVLSCESWLNDMLLNFISNAVKFTSSGTIIVRAGLEYNCQTGVDMILFEVQDTGKGVLEEEEDKLFHSFSQCQSDKGGTGLGIKSVGRKARIMGGNAGYKPNAIGGSIFYFTIPHFKMGQHFKGHPQKRKAYSSPRNIGLNFWSKATRDQLKQMEPKFKISNKCCTKKNNDRTRIYSEPFKRRSSLSTSAHYSRRSSASFQIMLKKMRVVPDLQIEDSIQVEAQGRRCLPQYQTQQNHSDKPYQNQLPVYAGGRGSCQSSVILEDQAGALFHSLHSTLSKSLSQSNAQLSDLTTPNDGSRSTSHNGLTRSKKPLLPPSISQTKRSFSTETEGSGKLSERPYLSGQHRYPRSHDELCSPEKTDSSLQGIHEDWKIYSSRTCYDSGQIYDASFPECKSGFSSPPLRQVSSESGINRYSGASFHVDDVAVLVVDDSEVLLSLYKRLLNKCNVKCVTTAQSGEECLEYFFGTGSKQVFDLLLIDDQMGGLRGPEIAREISSKAQHPPKIYLCTGNNAQAIQEDFPDSDRFLSGILSKPVPLEKIKEMIGTVKHRDKRML